MAENIFAEIYNKILGLFGQAEPKDETKDTAVNRLRLVLMQDRTNLTPEIMHRMRMELIEVLSTYVELDKEALELNFEQEGEQMALMLSIPVVRAKDEAEIEASIKEKEEAQKNEQDDDDDWDDDDDFSDDIDDGEEDNDETEEIDDEVETSDQDFEIKETSKEQDYKESDEEKEDKPE